MSNDLAKRILHFDITSFNTGEHNFVVRMFDDNQTMFNTTQHPSQLFNII